MDVLVWEVFLPERYKLRDFGGDVMSADLVPPAFVENGSTTGGFVGGVGLKSTGVNNGVFVFKAPKQGLLPGQIGGIVVDPSGAVIPNANVSLTYSTGAQSNLRTNAEGAWSAYGLPSGPVKVKVDAAGFKSQVQNLFYDSTAPQPVTTALQVGSVSETIEVSAANMVSDRDAERAQQEVKRQAQIAQNLPSQNVLNLQKRVAGVLPIAVEVPHAGTAFHFVRPLVVNEETKVTFTYKSKG